MRQPGNPHPVRSRPPRPHTHQPKLCHTLWPILHHTAIRAALCSATGLRQAPGPNHAPAIFMLAPSWSASTSTQSQHEHTSSIHRLTGCLYTATHLCADCLKPSPVDCTAATLLPYQKSPHQLMDGRPLQSALHTSTTCTSNRHAHTLRTTTQWLKQHPVARTVHGTHIPIHKQAHTTQPTLHKVTCRTLYTNKKHSTQSMYRHRNSVCRAKAHAQ